MSYVDVAIPAVIGLLMLLKPGVFTRRSGDAATEAARDARFRLIGVVLLVVAGVYLLIRLGGS